MELALLIARLVLATVFLLAGIAKLADPKGASKALTDFGLPRVLAALLSLLLPIVEIGVAVALVSARSAWYGACAALLLLCIFVIAIVINLVRGRQPDCHCFGQLHSAPVGRATLIRNGILGGLAAWLVSRGLLGDGPSVWQHLATAGDNERRIFGVAVFVICFLAWRATRRAAAEETSTSTATSLWDDDEEEQETSALSETAQGEKVTAVATAPKTPRAKSRPRDPALQRVLEAGTGWPIGTPAPDFMLPDLAGQNLSLRLLRGRGKPTCLVFTSPFCESCRAMWPYLGPWIREHQQALNLIVLSRDAATEKLAKKNGVDFARVLLQKDFELSDSYGVTATPAAVIIGIDGLIQSELAVGREAIQNLIVSSAQSQVSPRAVNQPAARTPVNSDTAPTSST